MLSDQEIAELRADFPMLAGSLIYFDTAATAQKPSCVINAEAQFYREKYGTVHRAVYSLAQGSTAAYQEVREKVASFLHAPSADSIVFTRGTTDSLNLVARSLGSSILKQGDEVVISHIEHHANIVPWQMICEQTGAHLKIAPVYDNGKLDLEAFRSLLNEHTKIVAITALSNAIGTQFPIAEICKLAHAVGAKVVVDGAQMAPHSAIDVQALDCDFFAFSAHKIYGPTGVGVLYGKPDLLEAMPPVQGGGDMIDLVTFEKTTYAKPPLRFEAGTPMIAQVIGLGVAIDYLNGIGLHRIANREKDLHRYALSKLQALEGIQIIGEPDAAVISFICDGVHPFDVGTMLDLEGIAIRTGHHCAQPAMARFGVTATNRLSLSFINTHDEIDRFIIALEKVLSLLCR
jgi:cysteine desulfurase/selenocysteine lyase